LGKIKRQIKLLSTRNLFCRKFAGARWEIASSCLSSAHFLNRRHRRRVCGHDARDYV